MLSQHAQKIIRFHRFLLYLCSLFSSFLWTYETTLRNLKTNPKNTRSLQTSPHSCSIYAHYREWTGSQNPKHSCVSSCKRCADTCTRSHAVDYLLNERGSTPSPDCDSGIQMGETEPQLIQSPAPLSTHRERRAGGIILHQRAQFHKSLEGAFFSKEHKPL